MNEEALAISGLLRQKETNKQTLKVKAMFKLLNTAALNSVKTACCISQLIIIIFIVLL